MTLISTRGTLLALSFSLFLSPVYADGCYFQETPDYVPGNQVFTEYIAVALDRNSCFETTGSNRSCPLFVGRQKSDFLFGMAGVDLVSSDVLETARLQINQTNSEIKAVTGIQGVASPNSELEGAIFLAFVDPSDDNNNALEYSNLNLPWLNIYSTSQLRALLSAFFAEPSVDCITLNQGDNKGSILVSTTLVKASLPSDRINMCVARAFVGGMGLNADLLFGSKQDPSLPGGVFVLPHLYRGYLEIHYSELVKPGMSRKGLVSNERLRQEVDCARSGRE